MQNAVSAKAVMWRLCLLCLSDRSSDTWTGISADGNACLGISSDASTQHMPDQMRINAQVHHVCLSHWQMFSQYKADPDHAHAPSQESACKAAY